MNPKLRKTLKKYTGMQAVEYLLKWRFVGKTEGRYVFLPQHSMVFCPIPKNASTTIQHWLYSLYGNAPPTNINAAIERYALKRAGLTARRALRSPDVFRFTVVRNPRDRVVSAFMSKVVRRNHDLLRGIGCRSDRISNLTFRSFTQELCQLPPEEVEAHVRPQFLFLGDTDFDVIGRFESLDSFLREIATRFGLPTTWGKWGRTQCLAEQPETASKAMADWTVDELRELTAAPPYDAFYDEPIANSVDSFYEVDLKLFGYTARSARSRSLSGYPTCTVQTVLPKA